MGRHGGGSRSSGGRRSSRSSGGSRGGGSRSSSRPFSGGYNRTYYTSSGRCVHYYTTNKMFGVKKPKLWHIYLPILPMVIMFTIVCVGMGITFGSKADGDPGRIFVEDSASLLSREDEASVVSLFNQVYEESGMPITLVTMDDDILQHYGSIEVLSEELYYRISMDEDACLILFLVDMDNSHPNGWYDWQYDVYCGDDTVGCFSDALFDKFLDNFQSGLASQDLAEALQIAWEAVMYDMAEFSFDPACLMMEALMLVHIVSFTTLFSLPRYIKEKSAYRYFQENPDKLEGVRKVIKKKCPNCSANNSEGKDNCAYCGTLLTEVMGHTEYV